MKTFLLGFVVCFSPFCHGLLKDCYVMDGSFASADFPCDPSAEVSACCGSGWICTSSLYCTKRGVGTFIGTCTDRYFNDNACPFPLPVSRKRWSTLAHYNRNAMPTLLKDVSNLYTLVGYTIPSRMISSSSATIYTSPILTGSLVNGNLESSGFVSLTGSPSSKQSTSSENSRPHSASSRLSSSVKAFIGIGIGLGIALLVCLAIIFLRRQRKRRIPADRPDTNPQATHWPITAVEMNGQPTRTELGRDSAQRYEM